MEVDASTELVKEFDPCCDNGEWITIKAELEWVPAKLLVGSLGTLLQDVVSKKLHERELD